MEPFIQTISVSKVTYPLYDHIANPIEYYFSLNSQYIWDKDTKKVVPGRNIKCHYFCDCIPSNSGGQGVSLSKSAFQHCRKIGDNGCLQQDL